MGDAGQPNLATTSAMKAASRCASLLQKALQSAQLTRFACGPQVLPMMPMLCPQFGHGRGSSTRNAMSGEDDGCVIDTGSNKSNCCIDVAFVPPHLRGKVGPSTSMLRNFDPRQWWGRGESRTPDSLASSGRRRELRPSASAAPTQAALAHYGGFSSRDIARSVPTRWPFRPGDSCTLG
jgi:hypothetical protein